MSIPDLLFSPTARVWNLRLLLLETIASWIYFGLALGGDLTVYILFPTFGLMIFHHIGSPFKNWTVPGLAIVDWIMLLVEAGGIAAGFFQHFLWLKHSPFAADVPFPQFRFACIPIGMSLLFAIASRTATIIRSKGPFWRQRFVFLGGCPPLRIPYTPMSILLNRSIARPLVRGESMVIIFVRALVLSCMVLGIPVFALYIVLINPIHSQVYTKDIVSSPNESLGTPPGPATFVIEAFGIRVLSTIQDVVTQYRVNEFTLHTTNDTGSTVQDSCAQPAGLQPDPDGLDVGSAVQIYECPYAWPDIGSVSISINVTPGSAIGVQPIQAVAPGQSIDFAQMRSNAITLIAGSHLFGRIVWTQRETLSRTKWRVRTVQTYIAEVTALQPYPLAADAANDTATLLLYQPYPQAIKLQQDTADSTLLSGLATFGGFWTFVNGAFALLFGANLVYFAFGRRPLSALGLIHICQRATLVRRWHADFPALHTEGGLPGSESAGVVAFIRQRLIDVGDIPPDDNLPKNMVDDPESLRSQPESRESSIELGDDLASLQSGRSSIESGISLKQESESKQEGIPLIEENLAWRMHDAHADMV
ncbi:hypothetical protein FB45DRAFT_1001690 [Roridomyces roridus]|uniref:Transmembrane protein n=1 Tax=Roridomyces roridus TaxID=1738132 RepID=A0AAD7C3E4_9AGAR|nr:hypothetical protein FB45DRAFT_1001690 [Roridomyces roridus]